MERLHVNDMRDIIYRLRSGEGIRAIARAMNASPLTVRRYRDVAEGLGLLDATRALPEPSELLALLGPAAKPPTKVSTVVPYQEVVEEMLDQGLEMTVIYERLRDDHGYGGSYSSVRRFIPKLHPDEPTAYVRVHCAPGQEAQVDFGSGGWQTDMTGVRRQAFVFVMTLSFSRHQYAELVFDQRIPTWLAVHRRAFDSFGGVPAKVVLDNLKAAVIDSSLHDPALGEPYRRFAQHYGFIVSPNRPATPRHKGKVESGIHYVKNNFLAGRQFGDISAANRQLALWVRENAGTRVHGTTHKQPLVVFQAQEQQHLLPLPSTPFALCEVRQVKVHNDCHVVIDGSCYSLPYRYVGQRVEAYIFDNLVQLFSGVELICSHPRALHKGDWLTRNEHYPPGKAAFLDKTPQRCQEQAASIGTATAAVVEELLAERPADRLRSVQALLRLVDRVGRQRLESACRRALHFGDPRYRRIKTILDAGLEAEPLEPWLQTQAPQPLASPAAFAFQRSSAEFFPLEERLC